jgi:methionyl aminopeptidase
VAKVLQTLNEMVKPGMNLLEIDEICHRMIAKRGAQSCYVDYAPDFATGAFGHYICTSVNDAVLHGKPYDYALEKGDLLSLDFACSVDGWVGDSAITICVGADEDPKLLTPDLKHLMDTTRNSLWKGIDAAQIGKRVGDISNAIGEYCYENGYSVNTEYGGHGVGHVMHGDPIIPNDGRPGRGYKLRPGLVIAIEPWILETSDEIYTEEEDGWTIHSDDGSWGAHFEHTIALTDGEPVILTAWD